MKKKLKIVLITILILLIVAIIGFGGFVGVSVFYGYTNAYPRKDTKANIKEFESEYSLVKKEYDLEEIWIPSTKEIHRIPALHIRGKVTRTSLSWSMAWAEQKKPCCLLP